MSQCGQLDVKHVGVKSINEIHQYTIEEYIRYKQVQDKNKVISLKEKINIISRKKIKSNRIINYSLKELQKLFGINIGKSQD